MGLSQPCDDDSKGPPRKKKKGIHTKRGATRMKHIVRARNKKIVFPVQWNERGQPIGKNGIKMSSYLGATTRSTIPINIEDWLQVPPALKNSIWEDVQLTFNLPEKKKNWVISQAGIKWREFKCYLTRKKIFSEKGNEINSKPPDAYPFIDLCQWRDFVASRLTDEFKVKSETNKLTVKENKYPQKRSRKGYARLEQDELVKMASSGNVGTSIPRATLWKLMRTNDTTGEISDEKTREVADQIDMLTERANQGEFQNSGREDVLFKALQKEEHGGRVRGVGSGVTITDYFGSLTNSKQTQDEVKELKMIVNQLKHEVAELKNQRQISSGNANDHQKTKSTPNNNTNGSIQFPKGLTSCKLALSDPSYRIVADGKVHNFPDDSRVLHGKPLLCSQEKVSIEYVFENETLLPVPLEDEAYTLIEALGTHVAWPRHLIILNGEPSATPKEDGGDSYLHLKATETLSPSVISKDKGGAAYSHSVTAKTLLNKKAASATTSQEKFGLSTCKLALSDPTYRVVAVGKVHNISEDSRVLHGKPLLPDQVRVSIEYVLENEALLPIPLEDEAYTIREALGTTVAWPKNLVVVDGKTLSLPKAKGKKDARFVVVETDSTIPAPASHLTKEMFGSSQVISTTMETLPNDDDLANDDFNLDTLPKELRIAYMYVNKMHKNEQIMVPVDPSAMNSSQPIFFGQEELFDLLRQEKIGACHMSAYIMMLYRQCQLSGTTKHYGFLCPSSISLVVKDKDKVNQNRVVRSRYIVDVLKAQASEGKVFLAPYNTGNHWILCVIDPFADVVFNMDSLIDKAPSIRDDVRSVVETALLIYRNQNQVGGGQKFKKNTKWNHIQCPQQTNGIDCGYFVLKFMRDIIDHKLTRIPELFLPKNGWPTYAQVKSMI